MEDDPLQEWIGHVLFFLSLILAAIVVGVPVGWAILIVSLIVKGAVG